MITEEVKELVNTTEQARELSQDCTSIALDIIKCIAFLHECGRFHGNLTPNESLKTVTKQTNRGVGSMHSDSFAKGSGRSWLLCL
ncbi:hypothetical protein WN943_018238 [Citrus x changshan-huyou]